MTDEKNILKGYEWAKEQYAQRGVDVDKALARIDAIPVSMHCWQGDDLVGLEETVSLNGGIAVTGNYPGRARNIDELRRDIDEANSMIPGVKKLNLQASYPDSNPKKVDRDEYTPDMFAGWMDWANERDMGLDFNATFFAHPMMDGNFTLASRNEGIRRFWVEHGKRSREIAEAFGKKTGKLSNINYWMPDGYKDIPADTLELRKLMTQSLDEVFAEKLDEHCVRESIESKLFGLGIESYTVASHEFSLLYAASRNKAYCLDAGHFHPTESIAAKFTSILNFVPDLQLHISRGVRWDSDHVVILDDELQRIMDEIMWNRYEDRVYIALDYFDGAMNRVACWVIGMRNARKALLSAALAPIDAIRAAEKAEDYTGRLALLEERKTLPVGAIWDYYCMTKDIPVGEDWLEQVREYEKNVQSKRI